MDYQRGHLEYSSKFLLNTAGTSWSKYTKACVKAALAEIDRLNCALTAAHSQIDRLNDENKQPNALAVAQNEIDSSHKLIEKLQQNIAFLLQENARLFGEHTNRMSGTEDKINAIADLHNRLAKIEKRFDSLRVMQSRRWPGTHAWLEFDE